MVTYSLHREKGISNVLIVYKPNRSKFQFNDNRSSTICQRKLIKSIYNSSENAVQRTKWRYEGSKWVKVPSSSTGTDKYISPMDISFVCPYVLPKDGDEYEQNTGKYTSLREILDGIVSSSGPLGFYDRRARTGFAFSSKTERQGPHTLAHITKRVMVAAGSELDRDFLHLIGTAAFPRPRQMNYKMRRRFEEALGPDWKKYSAEIRSAYLRYYRRQWIKSHNAASRAQRLDALRKGMESNPAAVYHIGTGKASPAEMAGKGESRISAVADIKKVLDNPGVSIGSLGLKTIDVTGASLREKEDAIKMAEAMFLFLQKDEVKSDDGDSESDSEIEDLDKIS